MSCVKTGAFVWFSNYGFRAVCDVYEIGDCYLFRWNPPSKKFTEPGDADWEVSLIIDSSVWFHREDLGITVVPTAFVCPGDM